MGYELNEVTQYLLDRTQKNVLKAVTAESYIREYLREKEGKKKKRRKGDKSRYGSKDISDDIRPHIDKLLKGTNKILERANKMKSELNEMVEWLKYVISQ